MADVVLDAIGDAADLGVDRGLLERALTQFVVAAEAPWPALGLLREGFLRHVATHLAREKDPVAALSDLAAADIYLAYGCIAQNSAALAAYDKLLRDAFAATAARLHLDEARKDDVLQRVRQRLLVGDGKTAPKILAYSGRGALGGWTRVAALRTAYNFLAERSQSDLAREAEEEMVAAAAQGDPEIEVLASRYGAILNASLAFALGSLGARERALLRYSFVEALSIDQIGAIYGVHRATAGRWVATAREALFEGTRDAFRGKVPLSDTEFDSMVRSLRSYLDMSLDRMLAPHE